MSTTKTTVAILFICSNIFYGVSSMANTKISDTLLSGWEHRASVALTSDYVWRGISQTNSDPAIQGQFDLTHDSGLYVGVWASNVEFSDDEKNSIEIDSWIGFSNEIDLGGFGISYDIGFLNYEFPSKSKADINEVYFGLGASPFEDFNLSAYYYHDVGLENKIANYYADISADYTLPDWAWNTTIIAHIGHYDRTDDSTDYWDWKVALAKDIGGFNFEVAYTETNGAKAVGDNRSTDDGRIVVTVSRELGGSSATSQDMLPEGFSSSASVALTTDYIWRGISQTHNDAAIQGSFGVAHDSGAYIGAWGSNIELGNKGESLELDVYAGFSNEIDLAGFGLIYDIGFLHYEYPSNSKSNFNEVYFGLGASPFEDFNLSAYYYHDVGLENKIANYYADISADYTLPCNTTIITHIGHYDRTDDSTDYWDWKVALAKDIGGFNFEVAYTETNGAKAVGDNRSTDDARVVATVSASF